MILTNYPKTTKYAPGDRCFFIPNQGLSLVPLVDEAGSSFLNGRARGFTRRVKIIGYETIVSIVNDLPVQETIYTVKIITGYDPDNVAVTADAPGGLVEELYEPNTIEVPEEKLAPSINAALYLLDNAYLNYAYNGDALASSIFRAWGIGGTAEGIAPGLEDFVDWAGMDMRSAQFGTVEGELFQVSQEWVGSAGVITYIGGEVAATKTIIVDFSNFTSAVLMSGFTTKTGFRAGVFSYDVNTIWKDGYRLGRAMSGTAAGSQNGTAKTGTVSGTAGQYTIAGSGTNFDPDLSAGNLIWIQDIGEFIIESVESDTALTLTEPLPSTFSGKEISINTLTGNGSALFLTEISVGDTIVIEDVGEFVVHSIASNSSLVVSGATFPADFTGKTISRI